MDEIILDEMDLPLSNENEDIETISKDLLRPLFDISRFEIRSEDLRDKGIDLHIELKKANRYTNFRLVVQLKATDSKKTNKDGSISLQLDTSNVNYLLNNPMPAYYVLYSKVASDFYYENLNDFAKLLSLKNAEWYKQKSHVLRFSKKLTKEAIDEIYIDTLQKGKFHRKVNEKLIQQSASIHSTDKILFDSHLNVSDDSEIRNLIESAGLELVNEGKWKEVILLHKIGSGSIASTSKYNLVLGIANYYSGNLLDALSFLKYSDRLKTELQLDLATHLEYFIISVKHSLGLCTDVEYTKRMDELEDADNVGLYIKIDKAKADYYNNLSSNSEDKFNTLINTLEKILSHPTADKGVKYYAECELVLMRGSKNNWDFVKDISMINAIETISGPDHEMRLSSVKKFIESNSNWFKNVERLKTETVNDKNYFCYFNTIMNEVRVIYEMTVFTSKISIQQSTLVMSSPPMPDRQELFSSLLEKLSLALNYYRQIGHVENEIVALSLWYELEHYLGNLTTATATVAEAEILIDTYELTDKKRRLEHLKNGGTIHERFNEWIDGIFEEMEAYKKEVEEMVNDMKKMDEEERKQKPPDIKYLYIELLPIGYFRFPENSTEKVYEILRIQDPQLKEHFDHLFTFIIPVANIYYSEIMEEGRRDGKRADKGIESWRTIYRVRKAFFENKFYRDESIP